jgi:hypothetical protein
MCQKPLVEVHHIHPEKHGGPNTIENAAPLCAGCHSDYGGNPDHRNQIREMRDDWWRRCAEAKYITVDSGLAQTIDSLYTAVLQGQKRQDEMLAEVKTLVTEQINAALQQVASSSTVSGVLSATAALASGLPSRPAAMCQPVQVRRATLLFLRSSPPRRVVARQHVKANAKHHGNPLRCVE